MGEQLLSWWRCLDKGNRLLILLRLGEIRHLGDQGWDKETKFGPPNRSGNKRGLCDIIQHPKALCWMMRDSPEDEPYGAPNLSNIRKDLKDQGYVEIHGKCDTIIGEEVLSISQSGTKIVFLSSNGREKANELLSSAPRELEYPPEWFLYSAILGWSRPICKDGEFYHLPVSLFDIRPKFNHIVSWSGIDEKKDTRTGSAQTLILNYEPRNLIDHITLNQGIHILQGDAGTGKTQFVNHAYSLWDPPHLSSPGSNTFALKFTVFEFLSELNSYSNETNLSNADEPLKYVDKIIVQLMLNQFPEGIDRGLLEKLLALKKPRIILFLDALDEIKMDLRPSFMMLINLWTLENPDSSVLISTRPLVTSVRHPSNLQTVIELEEISKKWPDENKSLDKWPRSIRRTPLTWKIVNTSKNRISDESDEEEILDRYILQSYEDALNRSGEPPPRKASEIINYLERIALYHNQRRETTILTIPELKEGETKEELESIHQSILPWVNTHMQILRETSTWKYVHLNDGAILSYEFVHRRIQEFLASRALAKSSDLSWINYRYIQDTEWGWPVIKDVATRIGMKRIIQHINKLDEDIFGHIDGLTRYLKEDKSEIKLLSRPLPPPFFDAETGEHIQDISFHNVLCQLRNREKQMYGDEGWNIGESVFGANQKHTDEVEHKIEQILNQAFDLDSEIDWVKEFGWPVEICLSLVNSYLDLFPQKIKILENPDKVTSFSDYLIRLFWQAKRPEFEQNEDTWDKVLTGQRSADYAERIDVIDKMRGIHLIKNAIQPPFKHPAPSLVKWWTEIGLIFPAIELTWMFDIPLEPDLYDSWIQKLDEFSAEERLFELGWYTHLIPFLKGSKSQPSQASHRFPLPRLPTLEQNIGQELYKLTDILDDVDGLSNSTENYGFIYTLVENLEIHDLLNHFENIGKMDLLKKHMQSQPFCPKPVRAGELFQDGQTRNAATRYHVEQNWFRNAWCHSRFEPGDLPLLADYPWFEELWG